MFESIIGHEAVRTFLERSIHNDRIAHAYLFLGPLQVGKMTVARAFLEALLHDGKGKPHPLEVHPDVTFVSRPIDEKTDQLKTAITILQIRELRERLAYSSLFPSYKIAIIRDAEAMTIEAANALLKTLEEPRGKTVMILLATDLRTIPETIRSRVQLVRFGLVPRRTLEAGLLARRALRGDAARLARIANGRPGRAIRFLEDPALFKEMIEAVEERRALIPSPIYTRLHWIDKNAKGLKADALGHELTLWRTILRDELLASLGVSELTVFEDRIERQMSDVNCQLSLSRLAESEAAARHHIDPRLALEHFLVFNI